MHRSLIWTAAGDANESTVLVYNGGIRRVTVLASGAFTGTTYLFVLVGDRCVKCTVYWCSVGRQPPRCDICYAAANNDL